ncbi:RNA pol II accessory factor, Cdc73 family [Ostertagia ostertagi]
MELKRIAFQNNEKYYAFGDRAYHKDTETNLLVYGKQNDYYTIDALLFLWEHRAKTHPSYVRDATAANVKVVSRPDRREILDYLSGNRLEIPANHNPSHAPAPGIAISRLVPETIEEPEAKKLKLEHNARPRVDQLLNKERVDPSEVRALNESLTADKIAALKQKRLTHQKTKIAAVDPEMMAGGAPTEPLVTRYAMDVRKVERVYKTRKSVMNATKKTYTFLFDVLKLIKNQGFHCFKMLLTAVENQKPEEAARRPALAAAIPQTISTPDEPKKRVSRTPIIIIPSAMTSLLTIFNAQDIIQAGHELCDNRGEKKGEKYAAKIDPNVAKWSVTRLPVSRTTRHMDRARFRVFWEVLDRWIPANRPHLSVTIA